MTDEEINISVARKLGWKECDGHELWPKNYCHSIEAAWEVVEQPGLFVEVNKKLNRKFGEEKIWTTYYCTLWKDGEFDDGKVYSVEADTAPMAICLAFLKLDEKEP